MPRLPCPRHAQCPPREGPPLLTSAGLKQLVRDPKAAGGVRVVDVPEPALLPGSGALLVRTRFSAISPGTERNMAASGWEGAVRSVRERPDLVRRVVAMARREGMRTTWERVRARLGETRALGSSSAGEVLEVSPEAASMFQPGDLVACTGSGHAIHGEIACVPALLCVRVPPGVELAHAAFGTLGAIALHAVRVAAPQLGERFAVIGLGIIGQLIAQVLRAHGARVIAFDIQPARVELALACGAEAAFPGDADEQVARALAFTDGQGVDGVIVAAASPDDAPMTAAARMARHRARVVATGLVPFSLPREVAYEKELELRISRSTGPGRHDPSYELGGADYPLEHVRWTVARNLEAFLALIADSRVTIEPLITRRLPLADAARAFEPDNGSAAATGILLEMPGTGAPERSREMKVRPAGTGSLGIACVGAGKFARGTLLPELARMSSLRMRRVVTATGLSATEVAKEHRFEVAGTDAGEAFADPAVSAVVIATRHDAHASLVAQALRANKHVFVEKPLSLSLEGVDEVEAAARESGAVLLVGFNRRFAPMSVAARAALASRGPVAMAIRVAAPALPKEHWLLDPLSGGGRLLGEGCHFVDLASFLAGDPVITASSAMPIGRDGSFALQLRFADGSAAQLLLTTSADSRLPKERIEAHAGGVTVTIDDYAAGVVEQSGERRRLEGRGKGHAEILAAFVSAARTGVQAVPLDVTLGVSRAVVRAALGS